MRFLRHVRSGVVYDLEVYELRRQVAYPTTPPARTQHKAMRQRQENCSRHSVQKEEEWEGHSHHSFIAVLKSSWARVSSSLTPHIENVP